MPSITAQLNTAFQTAIRTALGIEADPLLSVAQNEQFGDFQSNAAMGLAKTLAGTGVKTNPRQVAQQVKDAVTPLLAGIASEISVAGPGFINVRLAPTFIEQQAGLAAQSDRLGVEPVADARRVVVDYSGPNIAKELHVGHLRSTIIGDSLARVIGFQGHTVLRQNHLGDWGTQFGMLIATLQDAGAERANLKDLETFYVASKKRFETDPDFQARARENVVRLQAGDPAVRALWETLVAKTREHYQPIYRRLGVLLTDADERGESTYNDDLPAVVRELKEQSLAVESEGAVGVFIDGPERPPLIVEKTGGGYLYGTTDLAAIRYRVRTLKVDRVIYLVDARQGQHFAQVFATARKAGWVPEGVSLEHAAFGTMLGEDGRPFKSRSGGVVKLAELLDEAEDRARAVVDARNAGLPDSVRADVASAVGIGAVKYADLSKDRTSDYLFSFDKMLALDGNTAPYLLYAYARIRSIFRKAGVSPESVRGGPLSLESPFERAMALHILRLPEVIELVARELKPHHLCTYIYDLAGRFSAFFENCPVTQSPEPLRSSRLALCDLTARTMSLGMELLGLRTLDQM